MADPFSQFLSYQNPQRQAELGDLDQELALLRQAQIEGVEQGFQRPELDQSQVMATAIASLLPVVAGYMMNREKGGAIGAQAGGMIGTSVLGGLAEEQKQANERNQRLFETRRDEMKDLRGSRRELARQAYQATDNAALKGAEFEADKNLAKERQAFDLSLEGIKHSYDKEIQGLITDRTLDKEALSGEIRSIIKEAELDSQRAMLERKLTANQATEEFKASVKEKIAKLNIFSSEKKLGITEAGKDRRQDKLFDFKQDEQSREFEHEKEIEGLRDTYKNKFAEMEEARKTKQFGREAELKKELVGMEGEIRAKADEARQAAASGRQKDQQEFQASQNKFFEEGRNSRFSTAQENANSRLGRVIEDRREGRRETRSTFANKSIEEQAVSIDKLENGVKRFSQLADRVDPKRRESVADAWARGVKARVFKDSAEAEAQREQMLFVFSSLKPFFPGAISDQERQVANRALGGDMGVPIATMESIMKKALAQQVSLYNSKIKRYSASGRYELDHKERPNPYAPMLPKFQMGKQTLTLEQARDLAEAGQLPQEYVGKLKALGVLDDE